MITRKTLMKRRFKEVLTYTVVGPFMLIGGIAYIVSVGYKSGWAWAEHLGEKYL